MIPPKSSSSDCFHCRKVKKEDIVGSSYIRISLVNTRGQQYSIWFHPECFRELSGDEYMDELTRQEKESNELVKNLLRSDLEIELEDDYNFSPNNEE